jgi:hypothetical protein
MRMHIDVDATSGAAYLMLITEDTIRPIEKLIPDGGPIDAAIEWESELKFIEWWVRVDGEPRPSEPIRACYCDEVRSVIVICFDGRFDSEIEVEP